MFAACASLSLQWIASCNTLMLQASSRLLGKLIVLNLGFRLCTGCSGQALVPSGEGEWLFSSLYLNGNRLPGSSLRPFSCCPHLGVYGVGPSHQGLCCITNTPNFKAPNSQQARHCSSLWQIIMPVGFLSFWFRLCFSWLLKH